jgi:hypothetical protein
MKSVCRLNDEYTDEFYRQFSNNVKLFVNIDEIMRIHEKIYYFATNDNITARRNNFNLPTTTAIK